MSDNAKSRMDRIIRLHEEIDSIKADIREIYAEEKADGGDKTAMGTAISIIRKREKDRTAFDDREAMVDVYLNAYASPSHTHAREASQSYAEAKGVGPRGFFASLSDEQKAAALAYRGDDTHGGEIADTQEQPETANQSEQPETTGPYEYAGTSSDENPAPIPHSAVTPPAADKTGAAPLPSSAAPVDLTDDDVPAFLRKQSKPLRPHCLNPDLCAGSGSKHCYSCLKARDDATVAA